MNQGSQMNHPIGGSGLKLRASRLDGSVGVQRPIDAGNQVEGIDAQQQRQAPQEPER